MVIVNPIPDDMTEAEVLAALTDLESKTFRGLTHDETAALYFVIRRASNSIKKLNLDASTGDRVKALVDKMLLEAFNVQAP